MEKILKAQKAYYKTHATKPYTFRVKQLDALYDAIKKYEDSIIEALHNDLGKCRFEAYATEIGFCLKSIRATKKKLKRYMKPKKVKTPFYQIGGKSYIQHEPLGQVLIIGPYNYPFQLVIEPLIGAIAAGNTVMLKPSEFPSQTEKVLARLISETFDNAYIGVVTGDKEVITELLKWPFDHIFFTGSTRVGKIVYQAASKHLTPVTLELGGKSPTIVTDTASLAVTARRIVYGKFMNAGQTCIAPDYIYVDAKIKDQFLEVLKQTIDDFYPDYEEYGVIISQQHYQRLSKLIDDDKVVYGYQHDDQTRLISPVVMDDVTWDDAVMQEEIFGPILPVMTYQSIEEVFEVLSEKPQPLALYAFTKDKALQDRFLKELSYGGAVFNDTIQHVVNPNLPFGGIGESGIGKYHGKYSFEVFSHAKAYMTRSTKIDPKIAYPPYGNKEKLIRKILK